MNMRHCERGEAIQTATAFGLAVTDGGHCERSEAIQTATAFGLAVTQFFGLAVTDGGHCERSEAKVKEKYEH
jgi:hypothetical protein